MQRRERRLALRVGLGLGALVCVVLSCGGRTRLEPGEALPGPPPATGGPRPGPGPAAPSVTFAVLGDYGSAGDSERKVADLVLDLAPEFIITTGDNNYPIGAADTIDDNVGQYFHSFIAPYQGSFGPGARTNRFFPSLGNHDWMSDGARPYLDYFALPHNERYYDIVRGNVHLFAIDSDVNEPDGIDADSTQAAFIEQRLRESTAPWKVVFFHHPPYTSGPHGASMRLRWPFAAWGASVVFCGHDHIYERLVVDGLTYVISGVGGKELYEIGTRVPESVAAFDEDHGVVLVTVNDRTLVGRFTTTDGRVLDEFTLTR